MSLMSMVDQWMLANSGAATSGASDKALDVAATQLESSCRAITGAR